MQAIQCGSSWHLMVLATALTASAAMAVDKGLIGHWPFDEGSGTTAKDASGKGRHGTIHHADWAEGKIGGALRLNGKSSYVELGNLGEHDSVTIAFWIKPADAAGTSWQGLVSSDAWEEGVLHIPVARRRIEIYFHRKDKARARLTSSPLVDGTWSHVAVTASKKDATICLYVNGAEEDGDDIAGLGTGIKLMQQVVGRESGERYFKGVIDDVRIYDRVLALTEIQSLCPDAASRAARDTRNIRTGLRIPNEGYCDQPYIVITKDGHWLCTLTTGPGREGQTGQHVVATISTDKGRTWSPLIDIEPSGGPEASWIVPLVTPYGRVYGFYTYNGDNVHTLGGKKIRADTMGWYAFKYSDDGGRTWSPQRHRLPMRVTACDRGNDWQGKVLLFWGIDKPKTSAGSACFAFTKLGKYMLEMGEGWLFHSDNILTERDVTKLRWEMLPDGEHGIRVEAFGSTQEEHNMVPLSDGKTWYCVYRTTQGYPCHTYSVDGGHTWTEPVFMTYTPGGRKIKNPRACPKLWRTNDGRFLFWFHFHSGKSFKGRNPAWITGGVEKDGRIHWSQPEILLYDPDVPTRMSYPDLVEQDGRYWVTETNKTTARVHEIDKALLEGLWHQGKINIVARDGLIVERKGADLKGTETKLPKPLDVDETQGLSIDFWVTLDDTSPGQVICDSRDERGKGFAITTTDKRAIRIDLSDGKTSATWDCDPGLLRATARRHMAVIVDAGPRIITFVVDGILCDGGDARQYGWGRYKGALGDVSGSGTLRIAPSLKGKLTCLRLYSRTLRTSEAIANYHAGP